MFSPKRFRNFNTATHGLANSNEMKTSPLERTYEIQTKYFISFTRRIAINIILEEDYRKNISFNYQNKRNSSSSLIVVAIKIIFPKSTHGKSIIPHTTLTDPSQLNISHSSSTINTPPPIIHETSRLTSFHPSFSPLPPNRTRIRKFSRVFHGRPRRKWSCCEGIQGGERRNRYPGRG